MVLALVVILPGLLAPPAQAAFGPESFEAGTCVNIECTYHSVEANPKEAFTQAAGHPPWGITKFVMKHSGSSIEGASVKRIRVDVPPGLAANPQATTTKCPVAQFHRNPKGCPAGSEVGTTNMEAVAEPLGLAAITLPRWRAPSTTSKRPAGLPLDFGIAVEPAGELVSPIRLFLEGHVAWSGDYHEYFEINNVPNSGQSEGPRPSRAGAAEGADVETELQRQRRAGQLPDAAERLLEHDDLASGTGIVERRTLADRNPHPSGR